MLWTGMGAEADAPAASAPVEDNSLPQDGIFSSVTQSLRGAEREIVRGHFDLGSEPNVHRYYCLVDPKTGRRPPNGVLGDPEPQPDGTTHIKVSAVSLYTCKRAEERGVLVTAGYVVPGSAQGAAAAQPAAPSASVPPPPPPPMAPAAAASAAVPPGRMSAPATPAPAPAPPQVSADRIDVAGVKLGMSPDEVRAVLKSRKLADHKEWTETLSYVDSAHGAMHPLANGQFVSVIAAWTAPRSSSPGDEVDGESYEVMFTPVPGKERALAIVHSEGFSAANAIHEAALDSGLVKKYGGFALSSELPQFPTWRYQSGGTVEVGDPCNRRSTFGGLGNLSVDSTPRENIALKRTPDELQSQVDRCGTAIVTADHHTANGGALPEDRLVTRFTVTAYSPSLAFEGARAAEQIIRASSPGGLPRPKDQTAPNL